MQLCSEKGGCFGECDRRDQKVSEKISLLCVDSIRSRVLLTETSEGRAAQLLHQRVMDVVVSPLICCKGNLMTHSMYQIPYVN